MIMETVENRSCPGELGSVSASGKKVLCDAGHQS